MVLTATSVVEVSSARASELHALIAGSALRAFASSDRALVPEREVRARVRRRYSQARVDSSSGWLVRDGARPLACLIYGEGIHPMTRARERHVLELAWSENGALAARSLLAQFVDRAREEGVDLLRLEVAAFGDGVADGVGPTAMTLGFQAHHLVVRREISAAVVGEQRQFKAGRGSDHREFAYACLEAGVGNGLGPDRERFRARTRAYVRKKYRRLDGSGRASLVALTGDDRPAAHALVELRRHPLLGIREGFLLDAFVTREFKGQGWSERVWQLVEDWLRAEGAVRAEGTVGIFGSLQPYEAVVARLTAGGWWVDRNSMWLHLH